MSRRFLALFPDLGDRVVQMAFRIGYGPAARVRSLRRPVEAAIDDEE
jgi:hypothetical protein